MRIGYYIPPAPLRIGGLDLAIKSLASQLPSPGLEIIVEPESQERLDAVHLHGLWQPRFSRLAGECRRRGLPYVASPHGMLEPWAWRHRWWKKWPYFYLRERTLLEGAVTILATSQIEAQNLQRFRLSPPIAILPLGLSASQGEAYEEARRQLGWRPDEFVLLYLSRIHPKKGLHLLLAALAGLGLHPESYRLVIVGDGPARYLEKVKAFAAIKRSQLPRVDWLPAIWDDRKWTYLQGADLFCLPTHSENFGLAILEACQAGTPVLTTRKTPWGEFLGRHGCAVVEPEVAPVREGLGRMLRGGKIRAPQRIDLARAARHEFGWDRLRAGYHSFYEGLRR